VKTDVSVAERLAQAATEAAPSAMVRETCERLLIDIAGLCVGARAEPYIAAMLGGADAEGPCSAIGHARGFSPADAALLNGTAAHGEDFDDTFEGGPVHAGAVVVPAVLAVAERFGLAGADALRGIAVGAEAIAFKPYACGTMTHPYVDCARRLAARGVAPEAIVSIECETAEGILHRLWEPLADKQAPPNAYAAKFSTPYCIAAGFVLDGAALDAFTEARVADPRLRALAAKVRYVIDPDNPYPRAYTGHVRATLADGSVVEERQPHLRGGVSEPLSRAEIEAKACANMRHGGWDESRIAAALRFAAGAFDAARLDAAMLRG
jgi:2-methylcitrate dehydratase PrpD